MPRRRRVHAARPDDARRSGSRVAGIAAAWYCYLVNPALPERIAKRGRRDLHAARQQVLLRRVQRLVLRRRRAQARQRCCRTSATARHRRLLRQRLGARGRLGAPRACATSSPGYIYHYAFTMIIGVFVLLTWWAVRSAVTTMPPYLSLAIWVPIVAGFAVLAARLATATREARAGSRWSARSPASSSRCRCTPSSTRGIAACSSSSAPMDPALQHPLSPRHRRHLGAVHPAQQLHRRVLVVWAGWEVIQSARRAVHGGVPDPCRAS